MHFCSKLSFVLITQKPSASSSCLRCDIRSRRRVVQFSIYQNSVTRKRADQTAQILRLTEYSQSESIVSKIMYVGAKTQQAVRRKNGEISSWPKDL